MIVRARMRMADQEIESEEKVQSGHSFINLGSGEKVNHGQATLI